MVSSRFLTCVRTGTLRMIGRREVPDQVRDDDMAENNRRFGPADRAVVIIERLACAPSRPPAAGRVS